MFIKTKNKLAILLVFLTTMQTTWSLNIAVISALQSVSHYTFGNVITKLLLDRGHHVYELTTRPPDEPHPNRTSFVIESGIPKWQQLKLSEINSYSNRYVIMYFAYWSIKYCKQTIDSQATRDFLLFARDQNRPRIDVVVHDYLHHECLGPFASEFDAPYVVMTAGNSIQVDELMGGPIFPGFIPYDIVIHPFDQPLGWLKRLENKWAYLVSHYSRHYLQYPQLDKYSKEFFGQNSPVIEDVRKTVVVTLVNSHPAIHGARPQLPGIIPIGGFHVPPLKELPPGELKEFLDGAKNGFIMVSFGSVVPVSLIEPVRREALLGAFRKLSPLRVLLKWEVQWDESLYGHLPDNVFTASWIPQSDVMGHPNIRAFVTHCGGLTTNEIIARSVPIIAVPFYNDQHILSNKLVALNAGILLPYNDITEDTFYNAVRKVVDDEKYATAVRRLSSLFNDQPQTPQQTAVFWIEFAARHKTAAHLRSPGEFMAWATRWMVDDVVIVTLMVVTFFFTIRKLYLLLCPNTSSKISKLKIKSKTS